MENVTELLTRFLTGDFAYAGELQAFWMAVQGAVTIRNGLNKDKKLNWFHAFALSVMAGYAGASFGFLWMGKPSSMLSNDLNMASCIAAFVLVNYVPLGYELCNSLPGTFITVVFAQLFRSLGICKFVAVAFDAFHESPSAYYPIPIFGPILYATLLGNMGGIFMKGFQGHVENGMPWPIQNGLFCAGFFHFYVNDKTGLVGTMLRRYIFLQELFGVEDNRIFATIFVGAFMQIMGILQMPDFLGPSFSPFDVLVRNPVSTATTWSKSESDQDKQRTAREAAKKVVAKNKKNKQS